MCLPKPKENNQMAYVFMHWTPTVLTLSPVCDRRTVAYNSFVVWDKNFHSIFILPNPATETHVQLLTLSQQEHFPIFQTTSDLLIVSLWLSGRVRIIHTLLMRDLFG